MIRVRFDQLALSCFANSTIKMPFFAAIPINIIIPIWLKIFSEFSNKKIARSGETKVNGTESMITKEI